MANLTQLTERLWTGGDLPAGQAGLDHLRDWREIGVTHVIDNRIEWSDEDLVARSMPTVAYLHNGVDDAGQLMPDEWFDRGVGFAAEAWADDPAAVVVAHCHMGINRGPSMAYAILLNLGWDPIEAIDHIRCARPIAAVDYAEDALDWHLRRNGSGESDRLAAREDLAAWRWREPHDTYRIIRSIRDEEVA